MSDASPLPDDHNSMHGDVPSVEHESASETTKTQLYGVITDIALSGSFGSQYDEEVPSYHAKRMTPDRSTVFEIRWDPPETGFEEGFVMKTETLPATSDAQERVFMSGYSIVPGPNGLDLAKLLSGSSDVATDNENLRQMQNVMHDMTPEEKQDLAESVLAELHTPERLALFELELASGMHLVSEDEALGLLRDLRTSVPIMAKD